MIGPEDDSVRTLPFIRGWNPRLERVTHWDTELVLRQVRLGKKDNFLRHSRQLDTTVSKG